MNVHKLYLCQIHWTSAEGTNFSAQHLCKLFNCTETNFPCDKILISNCFKMLFVQISQVMLKIWILQVPASWKNGAPRRKCIGTDFTGNVIVKHYTWIFIFCRFYHYSCQKSCYTILKRGTFQHIYTIHKSYFILEFHTANQGKATSDQNCSYL